MPGGGKGLRRQQGRRSPETTHSESDGDRSDAAPGPGP